MFLHVSVILFTGGVVSQHALQVVSQHALQQVSGGGIPACTETDPLTATAAGGTHPTGMLSCYVLIIHYENIINKQ